MGNKKKYTIAIVAFILCAIMFNFAMKAERMYSEKISNDRSIKQAAKKEKAESKKASGASSETAKASDEKTLIATQSTPSEKTSDSVATPGNAVLTSDEASKAVPSNTVKEPAATDSSSNTNPSSSTTDSKNPVKNNEEETIAKAKEAPTPVPKEEFSFTFIDTVNGDRVILEKQVEMEGETVAYITCKMLDEAKIKYKTTGGASTTYFAAIDGLEEKKAGRLSGWCYYVKKKGDDRFHKPNVGTGQWIYHNGDLVVWKYLADGINDGFSDDWDD